MKKMLIQWKNDLKTHTQQQNPTHIKRKFLFCFVHKEQTTEKVFSFSWKNIRMRTFSPKDVGIHMSNASEKEIKLWNSDVDISHMHLSRYEREFFSHLTPFISESRFYLFPLSNAFFYFAATTTQKVFKRQINSGKHKYGYGEQCFVTSFYFN